MALTVVVKFGKPILKLKYRTLKGIAYCSFCICGIIFIYTLHMFALAIKIRTELGVYVDMISNNGGTFSRVLAIPPLICIFIDIFIIYYIKTAFGHKKNKYINTMLFSFIIVCFMTICLLLIFCILALTHAYSAYENVHDGIITAMNNYSKDSLTKATVDMMQVEYECCGSKNYSDWYSIRWFDANLINTNTFPDLRGETPFSCCSTKSVYPCIHHGIEIAAPIYIYTKDANISISIEGCHDKIFKSKQKTGWIVVSRIIILALLQFLLGIGLRLIQTAHTEKKEFDREDRIYTSWLIGCYAGKTKVVTPPPVPPIPPELMQ